jgi:hypothetical protein
MTKQQALYARNRDNETMTKAFFLSPFFLFFRFFQLFSFSSVVCLWRVFGLWRDAIRDDESLVAVATILGSRRSGQQLMAHGPARGQQGQVATNRYQHQQH